MSQVLCIFLTLSHMEEVLFQYVNLDATVTQNRYVSKYELTQTSVVIYRELWIQVPLPSVTIKKSNHVTSHFILSMQTSFKSDMVSLANTEH